MGPGVVQFSSFTMHLTYGDFDDGLGPEFRPRPADEKPTIMVTGWGEPVPARVTVVTFHDVALGVVREVIDFSRNELREEVLRSGLDPAGADMSALAPAAPRAQTQRASEDVARCPGFEFLERPGGILLATLWRIEDASPPAISTRVWDDVELRAFEGMAAYAEDALLGEIFVEG